MGERGYPRTLPDSEHDSPLSHPSKQKGTRGENGIVKRWTARGIKCQRVVMSGALGHILGAEFSGDVKATIKGHNLTIQSKCLADGWKMIYRAIHKHDALIIKSDRQEALVVIPESLFLSLVCGEPGDGAAESERVDTS